VDCGLQPSEPALEPCGTEEIKVLELKYSGELGGRHWEVG